MGAAIAYYTAFSLAPVLVIVIATAGLAFGREAAAGAIFHQLAELIGAPGAAALEAMIAGASDVGGSVVATVAGVALLALSATTVFIEVQSSLNVIWQVGAPSGGMLLSELRGRLASMGLILSLGFLLLVFMVVSAAIAAFGHWLDAIAPGFELLLWCADAATSFVATFCIFALVYRVVPDVFIAWRDVWFGAMITALLFLGGRWFIAVYIANAPIASTFGTASAFVIVLLWVYYTAQIFLFGAVVTKVVATRRARMRATDRLGRDQCT